MIETEHRPHDYEVSGEIAPEVLSQRLLQLPEEIRAQEAVNQERLKDFRQAELDLDRVNAEEYMNARATDYTGADAKMIAVKKTQVQRAQVVIAESAYEAAGVVLNKLEREFVALRKVASIRSDDIRMAGK